MNWLRTAPVSNSDVFRAMIYEEALETLRVSGFGDQWSGTSSREASWCLELSPRHQKKSTTDVGDQTHKHRVIWLCPQAIVKEAVSASSQSSNRPHSGANSLAEAASTLWKEGSLHILLSAPEVMYANRMSIFPKSTDAGDFVGVLLPWVGDKIYAHEALRKAAANIDDPGLGVLRQCFTIIPKSLAQDRPAGQGKRNVLRGLLTRTAVEDLEGTRDLTLLDDQRQLLQTINTSDKSILFVPSLAGTGKTTLMMVMLELLLPHLEGTSNAAMIIVPSRSLRDEVVTSISSIFNQEELMTKVIWLGRPAQELASSLLWDDRLEERVKTAFALEMPRIHLAYVEEKLKHTYLQLLTEGGLGRAFAVLLSEDWPCSKMEKERYFDEMPLLAKCKALGKEHLKVMAEEIMPARDSVIKELLSNVHVVVATCEALCKFQSGCLKGSIGRAVQLLNPIFGASLTMWRSTTLSRSWGASQEGALRLCCFSGTRTSVSRAALPTTGLLGSSRNESSIWRRPTMTTTHKRAVTCLAQP